MNTRRGRERAELVSKLALSLILPIHGVSPAQVFEAAAAAEKHGLDGLWVPDHLLNVGRPEAGVLECWTLLSALAARTERLALGPLVLTTPFRNAALTAKSIGTLDALAPGRLRLGLGSGGMTYEATCDQYGYPKLSPAARLSHCRDTVQALKVLLEEDPATHCSKYTQARDVRIWPRPKRRPPILLAARRPGMLRLTAALADGWNCPLPQEFAAGLAAIQAAGRALDSIHRSVFSIGVLGRDRAQAQTMLEAAGPAAQLFGDVKSHHLFGGPKDVVEGLRRLQRAGAQEVTLDLRGGPLPEIIERLAKDVMPELEAS